MTKLPVLSSSEGASAGLAIGVDIISPTGAKFAGIAVERGIIAGMESRPVGALHAVDGHDTQACGLGYRIGPRWGWNAELGSGTEEVEA